MTIRDKVFAEDEEQLIDIHDVKVSCTVIYFGNIIYICDTCMCKKVGCSIQLLFFS